MIRAIILSIAIAITANCSNVKKTRPASPVRIISLAPSITETLFALGLDDKIIGVTRYCNYPPEAQNKEKVGGFRDINVEKIALLRPDMIFLQQEHSKIRSYCTKNNIPFRIVNSTSIAEICSSFSMIGRVCNIQQKADSLTRLFKHKFSDIVQSPNAPKVLLSVGRNNVGGGSIQGVYIAGVHTFYNELIKASGGVNAFQNEFPLYPKLSEEGIIAISPDIIIDIAPSMSTFSCTELVHDWQSITMIPAVQNEQIHCLQSDYTTIPGPRLLLLVDDIKRCIAAGTGKVKDVSS